MFERYTERARRMIFFARYEASQYGSPYIETEHLLLGLLREDPVLCRQFLGPTSVAAEIRTAIEGRITRRERISTSVEMPLTEESKKALKLAAEESERLAHRHIGMEHVLVALLRVEGSLAAQLLRERGLKPEAIREQLAKAPGRVSAKAPLEPNRGAIATLASFLSGLKWYNWEQLVPFFLGIHISLIPRESVGEDETKSRNNLRRFSLPTQRKTSPSCRKALIRVPLNLWWQIYCGRT